MGTYKVGLIGFGFIGKVHAYGYVNLPLYYDPVPLHAHISHVCTAHQETAEHAKRQIGADYAVTDFREITENPEIDIVHICTPNHMHKKQLLSALTHQKHIYCDKPLVSSWEEAVQIQQALPEYKAVSQMTFQNRFFPATIRAKQLIDQGALGRVLSFRASYLHSGSVDPQKPVSWKLSAHAGGGVIADLASHVLDLLHWLMGDFQEIFAHTQIAHSQRPESTNSSRMVPVEAEDNVLITAVMQNGAQGHIEASKIATGAEDELRFEIHGTGGALRFNMMDPHYLDFFDSSSASTPYGGTQGWTRIHCGQRYPSPGGFPTPKASIGWLRAHAASVYNFLQAVANNTPTEPSLTQGVYVQTLIKTIRESARKRAWERV